MPGRLLDYAGSSPSHRTTPLYGVAFWCGLASLVLTGLSVLTFGLLSPVAFVVGVAAVAVTRGASRAGRIAVVANGLVLVMYLLAFLSAR